MRRHSAGMVTFNVYTHDMAGKIWVWLEEIGPTILQSD